MSLHQQLVALLVGGAVLYSILELIRRRKLREEYSFLWLIMGGMMFILVVWYGLLEWVTRALGIAAPANAVFFLGLITLVLINVHYSVKISELTNQVKNLSQEIALMGARRYGGENGERANADIESVAVAGVGEQTSGRTRQDGSNHEIPRLPSE